jgi:hypothetical protein
MREISTVNSTTQVTVSTAFSTAPTGTIEFIQGDAIRNITGRIGRNIMSYADTLSTEAFYNTTDQTRGGSGDNFIENSIYMDVSRIVPVKNENTVVNNTIRIWERIS